MDWDLYNYVGTDCNNTNDNLTISLQSIIVLQSTESTDKCMLDTYIMKSQQVGEHDSRKKMKI